ncbi:hypothetical protein D3C87_2172190 [compost metagenome]
MEVSFPIIADRMTLFELWFTLSVRVEGVAMRNPVIETRYFEGKVVQESMELNRPSIESSVN